MEIFVEGTWSTRRCGFDLGSLWQLVASSSASTLSSASLERAAYGVVES
jgi:hypothetical protein